MLCKSSRWRILSRRLFVLLETSVRLAIGGTCGNGLEIVCMHDVQSSRVFRHHTGSCADNDNDSIVGKYIIEGGVVHDTQQAECAYVAMGISLK
jgi:hypothetical protein